MAGVEMGSLRLDKDLAMAFKKAGELSVGHNMLTPEHMLLAACYNNKFTDAFKSCGGDVERLEEDLNKYLEQFNNGFIYGQVESEEFKAVILQAIQRMMLSENQILKFDFVVDAILSNDGSYAAYYVAKQNVDHTELMSVMCHGNSTTTNSSTPKTKNEPTEDDLEELKKYALHLNEYVKTKPDPIIGRQDVLKRTIQILCRRSKNNPVHIGEPGVGKTAVTIGLAKLINEGNVPDKIKGSNIFSLDLGSMMAGTQYRGDFEKRLKFILDTIQTFEKPIVYIDEIHNIVGAGAIGNGSLDASNILKPYLTDSSIKFIGATTYDEFKKHFEKDKALVRRFQTIDVKEPTTDEAIKIIEGLKQYYEEYHSVKYSEEAIKTAVELSAKYISNRYLPDKAIDIIDEAGAITTVDGKEDGYVITKEDVEEVIAKICNIPRHTVENDEIAQLKDLDKNIKAKVFGQDIAVDQIVRSIKMSRAGLSDENKPVASLLFVGPTGTGKTEIAKQLSENLGIDLVRFDMSEYTEKHSISKLIGSPAGYVGYEEGGLLVEQIKKHPHCVLLLDEIEKAHSDIYNILLQVMDYATLTDNQGRKADFKNVILIMTSNAGASMIGKRGIGFGDRVITNTVVDEEVKRTFTPEFRNRLTNIITFNHINDEMATSIAIKELNIFKEKLERKHIDITWTKNAVAYIADKGVSQEYGAREISRVVEREIKPLLMDEILFGKLSQGGKCKISVENNKIKMAI